MQRRIFSSGLVGAALGLSLPGAWAQAWPSKPLKWVVPFPPGGASDWLARTVAEKLAERLGQPVIVDNRAGAGGNIGTDFAAKSPPDGFTIVLGNPGPIAVNRSLFPSMPYDTERDLAPISLLAAYPNLIIAHPASGPKTIRELIDRAKASGDKGYSYGHSGVGSTVHLTGELLASMAGVKLTPVAYKGSAPARTDAMGGHIQVIVDPIQPSTLEQIRSGALRVLAVTSTERSPLLPDVPTVAETVPGFEVTGWVGVLAPRGVPAPVMQRLSSEITAIMQMPDVRAKLTESGALIPTLGPDYFGRFIRNESARWQKLVQTAGIKAE
jgi:tripartite-type tricarboxylate transporter receptor subunit TctC